MTIIFSRRILLYGVNLSFTLSRPVRVYNHTFRVPVEHTWYFSTHRIIMQHVVNYDAFNSGLNSRPLRPSFPEEQNQAVTVGQTQITRFLWAAIYRPAC